MSKVPRARYREDAVRATVIVTFGSVTMNLRNVTDRGGVKFDRQAKRSLAYLFLLPGWDMTRALGEGIYGL
jgi:hypothetical protein